MGKDASLSLRNVTRRFPGVLALGKISLLRVDANAQAFAIGAVIIVAVTIDVLRRKVMKKI